MNNRRVKTGLSLIEILVVVAILGLIAAILLPAVQRGREAANRVTCQNNLRQTAMAVLAFHDSQRKLPSLYNGSYIHNGVEVSQPRDYWEECHFHSWQSAILPHLEETALYDRLDKTRAATHPVNDESVSQKVPLFICPSTSNPTETVQTRSPDYEFPDPTAGTAARTDYESVGGVWISSDLRVVEDGAAQYYYVDAAPGVWGLPKKSTVAARTREGWSYDGVETTDLRQVKDGLSKTMMIGEIAGRPDVVFANGNIERAHDGEMWGGEDDGQICRPSWAISGAYMSILLERDQHVNQKNRGGLYGFHPSGANTAFADGSVRMIDESIEPSVVIAMATRAGGENKETK